RFVERPCRLHMATRFGALADQIVGAEVEGTPRAGRAADLDAHLRAPISNGRNGVLCWDPPGELNNWRASVKRDWKCDGIECEQVVHRERAASARFGLQHSLSHDVCDSTRCADSSKAAAVRDGNCKLRTCCKTHPRVADWILQSEE